MQSVQYLDADVIRVGSLISSTPGNILPVKKWAQHTTQQVINNNANPWTPIEFDLTGSPCDNGNTHIELQPNNFTFKNVDTVAHTYLVNGLLGLFVPFDAIATSYIKLRLSMSTVDITAGATASTLNTGDYDFIQTHDIVTLDAGATLQLECVQVSATAQNRQVNQVTTGITFTLLK